MNRSTFNRRQIITAGAGLASFAAIAQAGQAAAQSASASDFPNVAIIQRCYVVGAHCGWSNIGQDDIDQLWALLFRIENKRIVEAVNFPGDQHAADPFLWKHYDLQPIPDRLI